MDQVGNADRAWQARIAAVLMAWVKAGSGVVVDYYRTLVVVEPVTGRRAVAHSGALLGLPIAAGTVAVATRLELAGVAAPLTASSILTGLLFVPLLLGVLMAEGQRPAVSRDARELATRLVCNARYAVGVGLLSCVVVLLADAVTDTQQLTRWWSAAVAVLIVHLAMTSVACLGRTFEACQALHPGTFPPAA